MVNKNMEETFGAYVKEAIKRKLTKSFRIKCPQCKGVGFYTETLYGGMGWTEKTHKFRCHICESGWIYLNIDDIKKDAYNKTFCEQVKKIQKERKGND